MITTTPWCYIFTGSLGQSKPYPTGSGVVIKNSGHHSLPITVAKTITSCGTSYECEIEFIKLGTGHDFGNID